MDSGRRRSPGTCSNCCECLVPVRCVIDQHEVEIIPASARSSTSNDYPTRGGSSLESTSRTAYGSSSYRHQQQQQLSQRAAAVSSTRTSGLFYASHQNGSSFGEAHEVVSYRSAAPSDLFADSRQASWDSKAPRVPLINLRKIQHHGTSLPCSPLDSERIATMQQPQWPSKKEDGRHRPRGHDGDDISIFCLNSSERETLIWEQQTPADVFSDPHQDDEDFPSEPSDCPSICGHDTSLPIASRADYVQNEQDIVRSSSSTSICRNSSKAEAAIKSGDATIDIQCFALAAAVPLSQPRPGSRLPTHFDAGSSGLRHGAQFGGSEGISPTDKLGAVYDVHYAVDSFPMLGMDFLYRQEKGGGTRRTRTVLDAAMDEATGAPEAPMAAFPEPINTSAALQPNGMQGRSSSEVHRMQPTRQESGKPATEPERPDTPMGTTSAAVRDVAANDSGGTSLPACISDDLSGPWASRRTRTHSRICWKLTKKCYAKYAKM